MRGRAARPRRAVASAAALLAASAFAGSTLTAPPVTADAPDEPIALEGRTLSAVPVDLDGDGSRELVRLAEGRPGVVVDAWRHDRQAGWTLLGSVDHAPELDASTPVSEPLAIAPLVAKIDGVDRALIVTSEFMTPEAACCVEIAVVTVEAGRVDVVPIGTLPTVADSVTAVDVDADGTDELALTGMSFAAEDGEPTTSFALVRRGGDGWKTIAERTDDSYGYAIVPADTDGRKGTEVLVAVGDSGTVERLWWDGSDIQTETAALPSDANLPSGIVGAVGESLVVAGYRFVETRRWPGGGEFELVAREEVANETWVSVLDDGEQSVLVGNVAARGNRPNSLDVFDASLERLGSVATQAGESDLWSTVERAAQQGWAVTRNLWMTSTVVPGGWSDGRPAYLAPGVVVRPDGTGGYRADPFPRLVSNPIGTVGPGNEWLALCDGCWGEHRRASLWAATGSPFSGRLAIVPIDDLQSTAGEGIAAEVRYDGAVELRSGDDEVRLLSRGDGFRLRVDVPPGTVVVSTDGNNFTDHGIVEDSVVIEVEPPRGEPDPDEEFERHVIFIGMDGQVDGRSFTGTFAIGPPEVAADASVGGFVLHAGVTGTASPWADVLVDGRPVGVDEDGGFATTVDAPIWPRTVVIVARDPFGAEATTSVEVVGLVDYRGLPWAALVGVLTVVGGFVLFVRTPRLARQPSPAAVGDGGVEEIE